MTLRNLSLAALLLFAGSITACSDDASEKTADTTDTSDTAVDGSGSGSGEGSAAGSGEGSAAGSGEGSGEGSGTVEVPLPEGCDVTVFPVDGDDTISLQTALIEIAENSTLCFAPGTYEVSTELSLAVNGVTLRGSGMDHTIFSFVTQTVGSNGLKITSDNVTLEDFQVLDTPGDAVRADATDNIIFRRVRVLWPDDGSVRNGAYGLYPVGCNGVLIEESEVIGARDAGIYVGQSQNILVERSTAWGNVAGIEIENCDNAEVRNNHTYDNTGGILVFNLPGLTRYGAGANVHDNLVENNNRTNFGVEGTVVAVVPPGTGILVLANDDNEFHNNTVTGNDTVGLLLFTYQPGIFGAQNDPNFNKYATGNNIHDNTFSGNGTAPKGALPAVLPNLPSPIPDILWDGCVDPAVDPARPHCIRNNGSATFLNVDFCGSFANPTTSLTPHDCTYEPLPVRP